MGMANEWSGPSDHCPQPSSDRRMSEPARYQTQRVSPPMPPRPRSAQLPELHPNQEVILDEVGEGEMVENKLVIPDEMMQYLNQVSIHNNYYYFTLSKKTTLLNFYKLSIFQVQAGGNQHNYRSSPLPICQSPICTNPLHYQRNNQVTCNYNQTHQQNCYPQSANQAANQQQQCANYQNPSTPYSQCPSSRLSQASGYCPTQNYGSGASPASAQVMSPGSHYAPSHVSDQPMTSPAAATPAPQYGQQNLPQNSAQMTRNCTQNHGHNNYYQNYGCHANANNCTEAGQTNHPGQPCASPMGGQQCTQMRNPTPNCQPMSPHCNQVPMAMHQNAPMNHLGTQCAQQFNQCSRPASVNPQNGASPMQTAVPCPQMSPRCSQQVNNNPAKPASAEMPVCQHQSQVQCTQMNCAHPNANHHRANVNQTAAPMKPANNQQRSSNCTRGQVCTHNCQPRCNSNHSHQFGACSCQWAYDQCYSDSNLPEIQCRDISQSQQGSPAKLPQGMRQDSYRRTLEYVQQCRNWSGNAHTHETNVSSSTHPLQLPQPLPTSDNMIVNDMTSSLSSLLEENRYLQSMIQ